MALPPRLERTIVSVTLVAALPPLFVLWLFIGLRSMHRLGCVLEKTGKNLQEYSW